MKIALIFVLTFFSAQASIFGQSKKDSLIVFVGEKIYVKSFPIEKKDVKIDTVVKGNDTTYLKRISMDGRYIARYKILHLLHGSYKSDTIEFIVFDHYGDPVFSKHQTVLLFVSYYGDQLFHEKYQYFNLYKTKNGHWASPYPSGDYNHPFKESITVKPEKIAFKERIWFPINNLTKGEIAKWYPEPYYEIKSGQATPVYGNYIDELFKLKQQTILKARGIY